LEDFSVEKRCYFDLREAHLDSSPVSDLVEKAIQLQADCDVQTGLFYSGGIDSSVIAASLGSRLKCLMLKYDSKALTEAGITDDFAYSTQIAKILKLDVEWIEGEDQKTGLLELARRVAEGNEEMISDLTFTAMETISREAAARNYKVMLSGMGADEIFAGYPRYQLIENHRFYKTCAFLMRPFRPLLKRIPSFAKKLQRFYGFVDAPNFEEAYTSTVGVFSKKEAIQLVGDERSVANFFEKLRVMLKGTGQFTDLKKAMYLDVYGFLAHNFAVADKASMKHSIELRVPLATPDIARTCFAAPDASLIGICKTKKPLREILYLLLPKGLVDRRKTGFNPPIDCLVNEMGREHLLGFFSTSILLKFLKHDSIVGIVHRHFDKEENNSYKIWQLVYLHAWLERAASVFHAEFSLR
jgi:asparagine synthase (glutamine-hydrolysing)